MRWYSQYKIPNPFFKFTGVLKTFVFIYLTKVKMYNDLLFKHVKGHSFIVTPSDDYGKAAASLLVFYENSSLMSTLILHADEICI